MYCRALLILVSLFGVLRLWAGDEGVGTLPDSNRTAIDKIMTTAIAQKAFPGGQIVIGDGSGVIYSQSYGYLDYSKESAVSSDNIYDLASCTKVLATTVATMKLIDDGELTLDSKLGDLVGRFKDTPLANFTLKSLLSHTTGMKASVSVARSLVYPDSGEVLLKGARSATHSYQVDSKLFANKHINYDTTYISLEPREGYRQLCEKLYINSSYNDYLDSLILESYQPQRKGVYRYSDLNFYLLQQMVECASMQSLDSYVAKIYQQMGLKRIGFTPMAWSRREEVAPTECDMLLRRDTVRGFVHDEMAAVLGGVSGHAGLFARGEDVAMLCTMLLGGGEYNGERILSKEVVEQFTAAALKGRVFRGLGFDKMNPQTTDYSGESYGHTGFTGTYFWVDPESDRYLVILTNRVHPTRVNRKFTSDMRSELWKSAKIQH